jgi:hypothetical protein
MSHHDGASQQLARDAAPFRPLHCRGRFDAQDRGAEDIVRGLHVRRAQLGDRHLAADSSDERNLN